MTWIFEIDEWFDHNRNKKQKWRSKNNSQHGKQQTITANEHWRQIAKDVENEGEISRMSATGHSNHDEWKKFRDDNNEHKWKQEFDIYDVNIMQS